LLRRQPAKTLCHGPADPWRWADKPHPKTLNNMEICTHLSAAKIFIDKFNPVVTYAGKAWTENSRYWIYYDAVIDAKSLQVGLKLDACVLVEDMDDYKLGMEYGLWCSVCKDGLMGKHPSDKYLNGVPRIKYT
jgi:hypothetical protein